MNGEEERTDSWGASYCEPPDPALKKMESAEAQKQRVIDLHSLKEEEFAASYREFSLHAYGACFTYSGRRLDSWLERYLPQRGDGLRLLDVGCGTGHHLARLRQRGFVVAGVDGSEQMLEHARANNPGVVIRRGDVEEIPFPDSSFDFVLCIEVLRYLPDSSRCVQEMARVLKPGAVCLTTATPVLNLNGYWLLNRIANVVPVVPLAKRRVVAADVARFCLNDDWISRRIIRTLRKIVANRRYILGKRGVGA